MTLQGKPSVTARIDTWGDVKPLPERLEVEWIHAHQLERGRGGVLAVVYEIHWAEIIGPSLEREFHLQHSRRHIILYWSGTPATYRQENRLYRQLRIGAAHRDASRPQGQICIAPGYSLVSRDHWFRNLSSASIPSGAHVW